MRYFCILIIIDTIEFLQKKKKEKFIRSMDFFF